MTDSMPPRRYHVTKLYDEDGHVAPHFVDDEFHSYSKSWEEAMQHRGFAAIIENELAAERIAELSLAHLAAFAPNERVRNLFMAWLAFIDDELDPWTTGGAIHFRPHWARVLLHALIIADDMGLPDADLRALAMAAVFHDSRRKNPYLDTGHGARAARYYADECIARDVVEVKDMLGSDQLVYDPRTMLITAWHDRDDEDGLAAIEKAVHEDKDQAYPGRGYSELLPQGAQADAATMLLIFKDADALDRVRLGADGLDEHYLRTGQSRGQVAFARELLAACETAP